MSAENIKMQIKKKETSDEEGEKSIKYPLTMGAHQASHKLNMEAKETSHK